MYGAIAISFFTIFFFISWLWLIWRVDVYFGLVYAMLFVYTIFAQFGYYFRPDISMRIDAYFGEEVFWPYYRLVVLSFTMLFVLLSTLGPKLLRYTYYDVGRSASRLGIVFLLLSLVQWGFLLGVLITRSVELSYGAASGDEFGSDTLLTVTGMTFKAMTPDLLVWWYILREKAWSRFYWPLFGAALILFATYCLKLGNRTDILALFLGIGSYEFARAHTNGKLIKWLFRMMLFGGAVICFAMTVDRIRSGGGDGDSRSMEEKLVLNDYYAPSHMLFAAISYDFVRPGEVVKSNLNNAMILRGYPYLQATITDLFKPGLATRSQGYAFYIFTEGYLVFGRYGYLYNGIVIFCGLMMWRMFSLGNSPCVNRFAIMLICAMAANCVRGQSAYFIKYSYMYFIPAFLMFYLATGMRLVWPGLVIRRSCTAALKLSNQGQQRNNVKPIRT